MTTNLKVFVNTSFQGHYPVGTAAVVVTANPEIAAAFLNIALKAEGLKATATSDQMKEIDLTSSFAYILNNGDY